ncbi:hypothetical protein N136_03939, partial [Leifsonia aquatica ATCC 14665]
MPFPLLPLFPFPLLPLPLFPLPLPFPLFPFPLPVFPSSGAVVSCAGAGAGVGTTAGATFCGGVCTLGVGRGVGPVSAVSPPGARSAPRAS